MLLDRNKYRQSHSPNKLKPNPYISKQNPYKVKSHFYSSSKKSHSASHNQHKPSHNPQSFKYFSNQQIIRTNLFNRQPRGASTRPRSFSLQNKNQQQKDLHKNSHHSKSSHYSSTQKGVLSVDPKINRQNDYVMNNFFPEDKYLEVIKDKLFAQQPSEFDRCLRMSNIGFSHLNNKQSARTNYHSKILATLHPGPSQCPYPRKINPFLRQNLISLSNNESTLESTLYSNKSDLYAYQQQNQSYTNSPVINTMSSLYHFESFDHPNDRSIFYSEYQYYPENDSVAMDPLSFKHISSSNQRKQSARFSDGTRRNSGSFECSFGGKEGNQKRELINNFLNKEGIRMEKRKSKESSKPSEIQQSARKQIKIKGKKFYLSPVDQYQI